MSIIRVFLLDDHEVVRRGLADLFATQPDIDVVGESGSAIEATRHIAALRPDVAVLYARLPDGSGIDVCRDVRSVDPSIKAPHSHLVRRRRGAVQRDHGRRGGLHPQERQGDRPRRRGSPGGGRPVAPRPSVTARVLERLRSGPQQPDELRSLTDQERTILGYIAEGMTNRQIAEHMFLAEKTIKNHVSALLGKLGLERRTQAAVLATKLLGR